MRKNTIDPYWIIEEGDASTNLTSEVTNIRLQDNVNIQIIATGSPAGDFEVQVSSDYEPNQFNPKGSPIHPGTWVSIDGSAVNISGADEIVYDITQLGAPYIRVIFAAGGGSSGVINAIISTKAV